MLTKQELEEAEYVEMRVEDARALETGNATLDEMIDRAQAPVFGREAKVAYVIIKIVP